MVYLFLFCFSSDKAAIQQGGLEEDTSSNVATSAPLPITIALLLLLLSLPNLLFDIPLSASKLSFAPIISVFFLSMNVGLNMLPFILVCYTCTFPKTQMSLFRKFSCLILKLLRYQRYLFFYFTIFIFRSYIYNTRDTIPFYVPETIASVLLALCFYFLLNSLISLYSHRHNTKVSLELLRFVVDVPYLTNRLCKQILLAHPRLTSAEPFILQISYITDCSFLDSFVVPFYCSPSEEMITLFDHRTALPHARSHQLHWY